MNTSFSNSQATQGALGGQLQALTAQGMAGQGFTGGQEQNLRSDAQERSAQGDVQAEQALNQRNAGGASGGAATSGAVGAQNAMLASNAANQNATAQRGITDTNANLARQNVQEGLSGLNSLSGQQTSQSSALAGTAVGATSNAMSQDQTVNQPGFWTGLGESALSGAVNGGLALATGGMSALPGMLAQHSLNNASSMGAGNSLSNLQTDNPDVGI
jgi:hypothetical protein